MKGRSRRNRQHAPLPARGPATANGVNLGAGVPGMAGEGPSPLAAVVCPRLQALLPSGGCTASARALGRSGCPAASSLLLPATCAGCSAAPGALRPHSVCAVPPPCRGEPTARTFRTGDSPSPPTSHTSAPQRRCSRSVAPCDGGPTCRRVQHRAITRGHRHRTQPESRTLPAVNWPCTPRRRLQLHTTRGWQPGACSHAAQPRQSSPTTHPPTCPQRVPQLPNRCPRRRVGFRQSTCPAAEAAEAAGRGGEIDSSGLRGPCVFGWPVCHRTPHIAVRCPSLVRAGAAARARGVTVKT